MKQNKIFIEYKYLFQNINKNKYNNKKKNLIYKNKIIFSHLYLKIL